MAPVTSLLQEALFPLLHRRYLKVQFTDTPMASTGADSPVSNAPPLPQACGGLVLLLRSEYNLTEHFRTVQLVFLMEAGDAMQQFYSEIFQRVIQQRCKLAMRV